MVHALEQSVDFSNKKKITMLRSIFNFYFLVEANYIFMIILIILKSSKY